MIEMKYILKVEVCVRMKSINSFFKEVKNELSKIVWPSKDEFFGATVVALFLLLLATIFLGVVNHLFNIGAQKGFYWLMLGR
jgi:preprotein translocase SecE subunit